MSRITVLVKPVSFSESTTSWPGFPKNGVAVSTPASVQRADKQESSAKILVKDDISSATKSTPESPGTCSDMSDSDMLQARLARARRSKSHELEPYMPDRNESTACSGAQILDPVTASLHTMTTGGFVTYTIPEQQRRTRNAELSRESSLYVDPTERMSRVRNDRLMRYEATGIQEDAKLVRHRASACFARRASFNNQKTKDDTSRGCLIATQLAFVEGRMPAHMKSQTSTEARVAHRWLQGAEDELMAADFL